MLRGRAVLRAKCAGAARGLNFGGGGADVYLRRGRAKAERRVARPGRCMERRVLWQGSG